MHVLTNVFNNYLAVESVTEFTVVITMRCCTDDS